MARQQRTGALDCLAALVEGPLGIGVLDGGRRGIEVIAGDEYAFSPTSFSKYTIASFLYPNPDRDPDGFLSKLEEVIRQYAIPGQEYVLMPFHKETYVIARNRARFEPLIKMAIPTIEQILQVDDKGSLARLCQRRGLPRGSGPRSRPWP